MRLLAAALFLFILAGMMVLTLEHAALESRLSSAELGLLELERKGTPQEGE